MDGEDVPLVVNRATASLLSPAFLSKSGSLHHTVLGAHDESLESTVAADPGPRGPELPSSTRTVPSYEPDLPSAAPHPPAPAEEGAPPADADLLAALDAEMVKLQNARLCMESRLQSTSSALDSSQDESRQLKCLIAALHVKREDFAALHAASTTRASALQTVGCRILSALVDRDGPTISAHRGEAPEGDRRSSRISQQSRSAASPALVLDEYPEEAQIAAAALVAYNSDPVAALTALMEVALAARQHPAIQG